MTLLKELTTWIAGKTGLVVGQDLWAGQVPIYALDRVAVVMSMGGSPSQPVLRGNVGEYAFHVAARDEDPHDAHDLALVVHRVLSDCTGGDLGDWFMYVCDAVNEPTELGYDSKLRFEWGADYVVRAYEKIPWFAV